MDEPVLHMTRTCLVAVEGFAETTDKVAFGWPSYPHKNDTTRSRMGNIFRQLFLMSKIGVVLATCDEQ